MPSQNAMTRSPASTRRDFIAGGAAVGLGLVGVASGLVSRVHAADFRTEKTSDYTVLRRAIEAWKARGGGRLALEPGRNYDLGAVAAGDHVFDLRGLAGAELDGNGATLRCTTAGHGKTQMFLVRACRDLTFTNLRAEDRGTDLRREWRGMDFLHLDASGGAIDGVSLSGVTVDGAVSLLSCSGGPGSPRAARIRLTEVEARNCYYGLSFQENGDDVAGSLRAVNCRRAYFPYGVRSHDLALDIHHDGVGPGGDACILVKRYRRDTQDLAIRARFSGELPWRHLLKLETQPPAGEVATIRDVDVRLEVDDAASARAQSNLVAIGALRNGQVQKRTSDRWEGIRVSSCGTLAGRVERLSEPLGGGDIVVTADRARCT